MQYSLKSWPDKILSQKTCKVQDFSVYLWNVLDEAREIMDNENGAGIAAPQIGAPMSFFLIKLLNGEVLEVINPEIQDTEGKQYLTEGCLSFKNIGVMIERPESVYFTYEDREGRVREAVVFGVEAQRFSHEYDHLIGKTILDRVNRHERKRILKEMGLR